MKLTAKSKNSSSSSSNEGWGMGFLLVFFPEEDQNQNQTQNNHSEINKPNNTFNFLSPSSSSSSSSSIIKRTNSFNLLYKAQYTISICLLLLFTTLLLFTLSTLPPSAATAARRLYRSPRRHLRESALPSPPPSNLSHALQGVGTLYRRGTRAMNDLVVAHSPESLSLNDLKLFLRLFLRSSLAAKSDLLLLFPSSKTGDLNNLILREHQSFLNLLTQYESSNDSLSTSSFDVTHFTRLSKKERESGETIWGKKTRSNHSEEEGENKSNRPSYGSIVGFDADELDPENSLSGFFDHVPMSLRRWACYPMLLGRVRRNFKHVMLVDIKDILIVGDPLGRVRNQSPESILLKVTTQLNPGKHGKKNPEKIDPTRKNTARPGIVMGGSRGVRRLSATMLAHIVRASIQHRKKKNSVTESGIFNHLAGNDYAMKNVNLVVSDKPLPDLSAVNGSGSKSGFLTRNYGVIRRGNCNSDVVNSMVMKHICSFPIDSSVYSDC